MRIRITNAVAFEFSASACEHIPEFAFDAGTYDATVEDVRLLLQEAKYYTDPNQFEVGPYGLPLGTFNAFRALKTQCEKALAANDTARV